MMQADGKTVFTSDEALDLEFVPEYVAIVGSGYIGLEFSDVYTALGSEVTFIEVTHAVAAAGSSWAFRCHGKRRMTCCTVGGSHTPWCQIPQGALQRFFKHD